MTSLHIVLLNGKKLKSGEHPIVIRYTQNRKSNVISISKCLPELWDANKNLPKQKHPNYLELKRLVDEKKSFANKILMELEFLNQDFSFADFKDLYFGKQGKGKVKKLTLLQAWDECTESKLSVSNKKWYKQAKTAIVKYGGKSVDFKTVNYNFLVKYESYLRTNGANDGGIYSYMRALRAVFNYSIDLEYISRSMYPFDKYKVSKLCKQTKKRALRKDDLTLLMNANFDYDEKLKYYHDIAKFSFLCLGMNFIDVAKLNIDNIEGGRIYYYRSKTRNKMKKKISIKITAPIEDIIKSYKTNDYYIFPILNKTTHLTDTQIQDRITKVRKQFNKTLKKMSLEIGLSETSITSYSIRHSWATFMKESGASVEEISELMGHSDIKTTQIYLASFSQEKLDRTAVRAMNVFVS